LLGMGECPSVALAGAETFPRAGGRGEKFGARWHCWNDKYNVTPKFSGTYSVNLSYKTA